MRERTARAVTQVESLHAARERTDPGSPERAEAEAEQSSAISRWIREMEALRLEVKGLWRVDFETGEGAYCWRWPEERLGFVHSPQAGCEGRVPIQ